MAVSKDISLDRPTLKSRTDPPGLTPSKEAFALLYEREMRSLQPTCSKIERSTNPLTCCRAIWLNSCRNKINHVRSAKSIAIEQHRRRHFWNPSHLQKRKCCSTIHSIPKGEYDRSSDDVVTSTNKEYFELSDKKSPSPCEIHSQSRSKRQ